MTGAAHATRSRGFTLLELLVVVLIIAVLAGLSVIAISDRSAARLDEDARRLVALLRLAGEDAVIQGRELGIVFSDHSYAFYFLDEDSLTWTPTGESIFRERTLSDGARLELHLDDQDVVIPVAAEDGMPEPQVLVLSSGEMTPFEIVLETLNERHEIVLEGAPNGTVEFVFEEDL